MGLWAPRSVRSAALLARPLAALALAVALAASLAGCMDLNYNSCEDPQLTGMKTTYTSTHEQVIHRLEVGSFISDDWPLVADLKVDIDVRVDSESAVTSLSIELYEYLLPRLQVAITGDPDTRQALHIWLDPPDGCKTGLKGTITVPAPLESVEFVGKGLVAVDRLAVNPVSPSGAPLTAEAKTTFRRRSGKARLAIGEISCGGQVESCERPLLLQALRGGWVNVSRLSVRRARLQTSERGSLHVDAGEITEWAQISTDSLEDTLNLSSVTSAFTRIYTEPPFGLGPCQPGCPDSGLGQLTGLISQKFVLVPGSDFDMGSISTTVSDELCVDCGNFTWNEDHITLLGDFNRTGSCFGAASDPCPEYPPEYPSLPLVAIV